MFFFMLPWGVANARVRLPLVTIGIGLICLITFFFTWVQPADPMGTAPQERTELYSYWTPRPYLQFSPEYKKALFDREDGPAIEKLRAAWNESDAIKPDDALRASEQLHFDQLQQAVLRVRAASPMIRNALIPARGAVQRGWLTAMFIHFGFGHLFFNLLFLYVVGLMLEDLWGRWLFGAFYLVGGLVASLAHYALDPASIAPMGGASGAIAACMGAFAVRFATQRVGFLYFGWLLVRPVYGTFSLPAWLAGLAWFANEVRGFLFGGAEGVAVMAHLGGFAFGAAVAFTMKAMGLDKKFASTAEQDDAVLLPSIHPGVEAGRVALRSGDQGAARSHFESTLKTLPDDADAQLELAKLDFVEDHGDAAHQRLEKFLSELCRQHRTEQAAQMLLQVWVNIRIEALSPSLCWQLGRELQTLAPEIAELVLLRASDEVSLRGDKALVIAAELRVARFDAPWLASEYLARRKVDPQLQSRVDAVLAKAPPSPQLPEESGLDLDFASRAAPPPPRVVAVVLVELLPVGLRLQSATGDVNTLSYQEVLAIAPALVPIEGATRSRLLVDLIVRMSPGTPSVALRLDSDRSSALIAKHFAGASPREFYAAFLQQLISKSNARTFPDAETVSRGEFPRHQSTAAFETAIYGTAAVASA